MASYYDIKSIMLPHNEDELHIKCGTAEIEDGAVTAPKLDPVISADLSSVVDSIGTVPTTVQLGGYTEGAFWDDQGDTAFIDYFNDYTAYDPIEVTPGVTYSGRVYQRTSAKQDMVVFADEDMTVLLRIRGQTTGRYSDFSASAPAESKYLLITTRTNYPPEIYKDSFLDVNAAITDLESRKWEYLKGKTVAIIGDSISTNGNPGPDAGEYPNAVEITVTSDDVGVGLSAYLTTQDVNAGLSLGGHTYTQAEAGTEVSFTPTQDDIGKMIGLPANYNAPSKRVWWEVAADALGFTPIPVCWSGSSITSHEGDKTNYLTSYSWHEAQIRKCGIRTPGTMERTAPDVVIVYRGTNDMSHTPYTRLTDGYFDGANWTYPNTDLTNDGYGYKEGLCLLVKKLRETYPEAVIYLCTLNVFKRVNYSRFPTNNGLNTLPEYNNAIREVANYLGCGVIEFDKDGITFENCYTGGYITDSATTPTHPSDKGHMVMGLKAISDLKSSFVPIDVE